MHTKTVFRVAQALADVDIAALRFNFRGVGTSTGSYEEGVGERSDVTAALDWLEDRYPGLPLVAGGVSFGSMVALGAAAPERRVITLFGVGLPIRHNDFAFLGKSDKPVLIVQGEEDEFGSGREIEAVARQFGPHVTLVRISSADHLFNGCVNEMRTAISKYFERGERGHSV